MIVCEQFQFKFNQMKLITYIILISAVGYLVQYVFCNQELLSKFHQHGYKIKDVRIEVISYNPDYYKQCECIPFKYNRSTTVHNISSTFKVDVKDDIEAVVQVYKFLSNEYRHFPVRFQVNVNKALHSNAIGLKQSLKCGNVKDFYFYKDVTYRVCNFFIDETLFPPLIPNGKYKVVAQLLHFDTEILVGAMYGEVYTPIPYPKNPKKTKS